MAKITRLFDINDEVLKLRERSADELLSTGFKTLDQFYMVKPVNTTIIYGYPKMGKSEWLFQLLISLSVKYGKKHLIYSPESGSASEIYAALVHGLTGKTFDKRYSAHYITEQEYYKVQPFIQDHFIVAEDTDESGLDFEEYVSLVKQCKKDFGIHTSSIDNWNDLEHESYANIADYLKKRLRKWNKLAINQNIHSFLVCHARNPSGLKNGEMPKAPTPFEIDGGAAWLQKAYNMICINRGYEERNGKMELGNNVDVIIQKVKPRIVGKTGICTLGYDWMKKCYYETVDGQMNYIDTGFKEKWQIPTEIKAKIDVIQSTINLADLFNDNEAPF